MRAVLAISLLALSACVSPNPESEGKTFAPFPGQNNEAFACSFWLANQAGDTVFGTDIKDDQGQAFTYFGRETLRLVALEPVTFGAEPLEARYSVYDYPDFRLTLKVEPNGDVGYAGTMEMTRQRGEESTPMSDVVNVEGLCAG